MFLRAVAGLPKLTIWLKKRAVEGEMRLALRWRTDDIDHSHADGGLIAIARKSGVTARTRAMGFTGQAVAAADAFGRPRRPGTACCRCSSTGSKALMQRKPLSRQVGVKDALRRSR